MIEVKNTRLKKQFVRFGFDHRQKQNPFKTFQWTVIDNVFFYNDFITTKHQELTTKKQVAPRFKNMLIWVFKCCNDPYTPSGYLLFKIYWKELITLERTFLILHPARRTKLSYLLNGTVQSTTKVHIQFYNKFWNI